MRVAVEILAVWTLGVVALVCLALFMAWFSSQPWAGYVLAFVIGCAIGMLIQGAHDT